MADSVIEITVDSELKERLLLFTKKSGLGLFSALRMFLWRSVLLDGVPFSMTLPSQEYKAERAGRAMQSLSDAAQKKGAANMTLDEINAEIAAVRAERGEREAKKG